MSRSYLVDSRSFRERAIRSGVYRPAVVPAKLPGPGYPPGGPHSEVESKAPKFKQLVALAEGEMKP